MYSSYPLVKDKVITHGFKNDNEFIEYLNELLFSKQTKTFIETIKPVWWPF